MKIFCIFAVTGILALLAAHRVHAEQHVPAELRAAIAKRYPYSEIMRAEDLASDCEPMPTPGFIRGDFNGDGRNDYAVLLKGPGRLAVFFGNKNGGFVPLELGFKGAQAIYLQKP